VNFPKVNLKYVPSWKNVLRISGYQILDKWLKDRKERRLSLDEIKNYCRTATAIIKTVEIQKELDDVYLEAEKRNGV
jgi:hypothetical protein